MNSNLVLGTIWFVFIAKREGCIFLLMVIRNNEGISNYSSQSKYIFLKH